MSLVSVVVPCYNQAQYLDECLQSVLDQTYTNWECIIVNDGSPDNTEEIAMQWVAKDVRFRYLNKENGGLSSARNAGIEIAEGEWILPLDADDKISDNYMAFAETYFHQGFGMINCDVQFFGESNNIWILPDFDLLRLAKNNIFCCTSFFRKSLWCDNGGFDEFLKNGLEDWDFWISILKSGNIKVYKLDKVCFYYRAKKCNTSMSGQLNDSNNGNIKTEIVKYIEKKHIDFFQQQLGSLSELSLRLDFLNTVIVELNSTFFVKLYYKLKNYKKDFNEILNNRNK